MQETAQKFHDKCVGRFSVGPDGKTPQYPDWFCKMMNVVDDRVTIKCSCRWMAPYGFVVEADCPIHD